MTSRSLLLLLPLLLSPACHEIGAALGPPQEARRHVQQLFAALAGRFGPTDREPSFAALRPKLVRAALAPSRLYGDRGAWSAFEPSERGVQFRGSPGPGRYRMGVQAQAAAPLQAGEYRGLVRLRGLGEGEYEWAVRDELAVGEVPVERLAAAFSALLRGADSPQPDARAGAPAAFPRAAAAFGRLYRLEALQMEPGPEGGTLVTLGVRMDPSGIARTHPRYARFLAKYATPMRIDARATDAGGAAFWELALKDLRLTLRLRVHDGDLAPLAGPLRPMPDRIRITTDYSTKAGVFTVGVRRLMSMIELTREPREKAFNARFREPPEWRLPFLVRPFLRGPLRRPFEGEGAALSFRLIDGPPTLLVREYRVAVKESWIVRWLGGLAGSAVSDFRQNAEEESDRFSAECLLALRDDLSVLSSPP